METKAITRAVRKNEEVEIMERFKADTIGALFESTNDYYITISLTDNYCLYIEGLNED